MSHRAPLAEPGLLDGEITPFDIADHFQAARPPEKRAYPTEEQERVIRAPLEPTLVVAGAGSGKTRVMAERVVYLVANGFIAPHEILGVTFSRKAAAELKERITGYLNRLKTMTKPDGAPVLEPQQLVPEALRHSLAERMGHSEGDLDVAGIDDFLTPEISTYHSYAAGLTKEHGLRIGLEPGLQELDETTAFRLARDVVTRFGTDEDLTRQVPYAETLTEDLITQGRSPARTARHVLDFISQCAEHMVEPMCSHCLQAPGAETTEPPEPREHCAAGEEPACGFGFLSREINRAYAMGYDPHGATHDARQLMETLRDRRVTAALAHLYQQQKLAAGFIDFGDMLRYAAQIAATVPEARSAERSTYRLVLLDEFQDTSYTQLQLFRSLFSRGEGDGPAHAVTAVGDPNQSIYGFRGASSGQLYDFATAFPDSYGHDAALLQLTTAWRNSAGVLNAGNQLVAPFAETVQNTPADLADRTWKHHRAELRRQLSTLQPRQDAPAGEVHWGWYYTADAEAAAVVQEIHRIRQDHRYSEGGDVAPSIAVLARTHGQLEAIGTALDAAGIPAEQAGISGLLRTPEVIELLSYLKVLADPSADDAAVRILSGAKFRIGPRDLRGLAEFATVLRPRPRGTQSSTWAAETNAENQQNASSGGAADAAGGTSQDTTEPSTDDRAETVELEPEEMPSLIEALLELPAEFNDYHSQRVSISAEGHHSMLSAQRLIRSLQSHFSSDLPSLIHRVITTTGLDVEVMSRPWASPQTAMRQLNQLVDYAESFISADAADLSTFLDWLEDAEDQEKGLKQGEVEARDDVVQLLTAHGSKGLEWDAVFVVGMRNKRFPSRTVTRWTSSESGLLPWPLRGDWQSLPQWDTDQPDIKKWAWAAGKFKKSWTPDDGSTPSFYADETEEFHIQEERRLAYVAMTRAKGYLMCSGAEYYGEAVRAEGPSQFLREIAELWADIPGAMLNPASDEDAANPQAPVSYPIDHQFRENPHRGILQSAQWPQDPLMPTGIWYYKQPESEPGGDYPRRQPLHEPTAPPTQQRGVIRRPYVEAAAARVQDAQRQQDQIRPESFGLGPVDSTSVDPDQTQPEQAQPPQDEPQQGQGRAQGRASWQVKARRVIARAALQQRSAPGPQLPGSFAASGLAELHAHPESVAEQVRRPLPREPKTQLRRGTAVHEFIEDFFGHQAGFDDVEDPLQGDKFLDAGFDRSSVVQALASSPWSHRVPAAMEEESATAIAGLPIHGRIDAIFGRDAADTRDITAEEYTELTSQPPDQRAEAMASCHWELVDWKTGGIPTGEDLAAKQLQLEVYRVAFHREYGVPLEQVTVAFYYIDHAYLLRPDHLQGSEELEETLAAARAPFGDVAGRL